MSQMICSYIEYKIEPKHSLFSLFGRVFLEHDYTFMALLGGGPRQDMLSALFPLRGIPADRNPLTFSAFYLKVSDKKTDKERWILRCQAEQWIAAGEAKWIGENYLAITDPDYFGPSWLMTEELEQVYRDYQRQTGCELLSVGATLGAMRLLPEARLVYWFGN